MSNYIKLKENNGCGVYWKETEYIKDGEPHKLTQLVLRIKTRDEVEKDTYNLKEIVLSNKENYKVLYYIKVNNLA